MVTAVEYKRSAWLNLLPQMGEEFYLTVGLICPSLFLGWSRPGIAKPSALQTSRKFFLRIHRHGAEQQEYGGSGSATGGKSRGCSGSWCTTMYPCLRRLLSLRCNGAAIGSERQRACQRLADACHHLEDLEYSRGQCTKHQVRRVAYSAVSVQPRSCQARRADG